MHNAQAQFLGQLGGHDDLRFMGQRINELDPARQAQLNMGYASQQAANQHRAALYAQANQQNQFAFNAGLSQNQMAWRDNMAALQNRQMEGRIVVKGLHPDAMSFKQTPIKHASWFRQWCWRRKLAFGEMLIRFGDG